MGAQHFCDVLAFGHVVNELSNLFLTHDEATPYFVAHAQLEGYKLLQVQN